MVQLNFKNATISADRFGFSINGCPVEDLINVALGVIPDIGYKSEIQQIDRVYGDVSITIKLSEPHSSISVNGGQENPFDKFMENQKNEYLAKVKKGNQPE